MQHIYDSSSFVIGSAATTPNGLALPDAETSPSSDPMLAQGASVQRAYQVHLAHYGNRGSMSTTYAARGSVDGWMEANRIAESICANMAKSHILYYPGPIKPFACSWKRDPILQCGIGQETLRDAQQEGFVQVLPFSRKDYCKSHQKKCKAKPPGV